MKAVAQLYEIQCVHLFSLVASWLEDVVHAVVEG